MKYVVRSILKYDKPSRTVVLPGHVKREIQIQIFTIIYEESMSGITAIDILCYSVSIIANDHTTTRHLQLAATWVDNAW